MKQNDHQEKQQELEQAFNEDQTTTPKTNNQDPILGSSQLVEMSGMLFDLNDNDQKNGVNATTLNSNEQQVQNIHHLPNELMQAQQAVQQAQQQLLNENQQLQQALYQLHLAQEKVRQCQTQVQQAQQQVQTTQTTASSIVNSLK